MAVRLGRLLALKEAMEKGEVSRDDIPYALHTELPRKCKPDFLLRFAKERGLARWESIIDLIDSVRKTCKKKAAALRKLIAEANGTQKEAPRAERKVTRAPRGERQARSAAEDLAKSKRRGPRPRREHRDPLRDLLRSLDKAAVAQLLRGGGGRLRESGSFRLLHYGQESIVGFFCVQRRALRST